MNRDFRTQVGEKRLYRETLPFKSESFDVFASTEQQSTLKLNQSMSKYNHKLKAIDADITLNEHSQHLAKSEAINGFIADVDNRVNELENVMNHRLEVAQSNLFSRNTVLDTKQIQMLSAHLEAYKKGNYDLENPIQASVMIELVHQGLIPRTVMQQIDNKHSRSEVEIVKNVETSIGQIEKFKSDLVNYNRSFDHHGAEKIKATKYSADGAGNE